MQMHVLASVGESVCVYESIYMPICSGSLTQPIAMFDGSGRDFLRCALIATRKVLICGARWWINIWMDGWKHICRGRMLTAHLRAVQWIHPFISGCISVKF